MRHGLAVRGIGKGTQAVQQGHRGGTAVGLGIASPMSEAVLSFRSARPARLCLQLLAEVVRRFLERFALLRQLGSSPLGSVAAK